MKVNQEQATRPRPGAEGEAAYFFIEGVFYVQETAEVCAQLTRDVHAWAEEHAGGGTRDDGGACTGTGAEHVDYTSLQYFRAAQWIMGLVDKETEMEKEVERERERERSLVGSESTPPQRRGRGGKRKRVTATEDSATSSSPSSLPEGGAHNLTPATDSTATAAQMVSQGQGTVRKEDEGSSNATASATSATTSTAAATAAATATAGYASRTAALSTTARLDRPLKKSNRKPSIASRYIHTLLDHLQGQVSGSDNDTSASASAGGVTFRPMQTAILSSLQFRIGVRYLFCHLNACEHFLYFSDVHLNATASGSSSSISSAAAADAAAQYPKLLYRGHMLRRPCGVCNLWSAKCVVFDDRLTAENPTFFCEHCYHLLHYDHNGALLYDDFKVFPYLHDMV